MKERFMARVVIDRGARQGVFAGMLLYTGQGELRIEQVGDDEATATHRWFEPAQRIEAGAQVRSRR